MRKKRACHCSPCLRPTRRDRVPGFLWSTLELMIRDRSDGYAWPKLGIAAAAMLVAALLLVACGGPPQVRNVVLICIDTVRYDAFWLPELSGEPDDFTKWTHKAVVYTHALSAAPWTVPSVATVFTGYYPSQHGAGLFDDPIADLSDALPSRIFEDLPTVTELINEADIRTMGYSSHPWFNSGYGLKRGFRQLYLYQGAPRLLKEAEVWLNERDLEQRFFLYLHFMEAHERSVDPVELEKQLASVAPSRVEQIEESAPAGICDDRADGMCDRWLAYNLDILELRGRLATFLGDLERRGLLTDTAVILYSDHGEEFYDHLAESEKLSADPRGIYGFGHGHSLYQELLHVPLLVWLPKNRGGVVDTPVNLVDISPAVLSWFELSGHEKMAGEPLPTRVRRGGLSKAALREPWPESGRVLFASGIAYGPEQFAVLRGPRKYVWHERSRTGELFDLSQDSAESAAFEDETATERLDTELDRYLGWYSERQFETPSLSDEQLETLKGIGYLQGVGDNGENDENQENDRQSLDDE